MKRLYHYPAMILLTIFAVIMLLVFELSMFVKFVLFKPDIYSQTIGMESIGKVVYNDLTEYFTRFSAPTGIPAEVFNDHLSESVLLDKSFSMIESSIEYLSNPNAPEPVFDYDFTSIDKSVTDYIRNHSAAIDTENSEEVQQAVSDVDINDEDLINNTIAVVHEQIQGRLDVLMLYKLSKTGVGAKVHKYSGILPYLLIGSGVLLAAAVLLMLLVDRRHPRDLPYWFGNLLLCSSVVVLIPCVYLQRTNYFDSFFVRNEPIYKSVTGLCSQVLTYISDFQFVAFLMGLALIMITIIIHMIYVKYVRKKADR